MKVPSNKAFNGSGFNDLLDADLELQGRAADHMLLLWASFHQIVTPAYHKRYPEILHGWPELDATPAGNGNYGSYVKMDAFGCPILPQDLRDKLRELYIAAAKENS